jgi:hypothetical protein
MPRNLRDRDESSPIKALVLAILAASLGIALGMVTWQRGRRRSRSSHHLLGDTHALDPAELARLDADLESHER